MKIQRRIVRRQTVAFFLIAAVCSLGASAVYGSGSFAPLPPGSLQFHFAPITWASIATSTPARSKSLAATIPKTAPISRKAAPTPQRGEVLGASVSLPDTVTHSELTAALDELSNSLRQIVYANLSAPNSLPATGGYTNSIALSNRIDQLSGTKLSNITVSGVSGLTAADIPTGITAANYLPLAGGMLTGDLTGTDLTLSGNLTVIGAQTLSGAITVPYLVATSTTASIFSGGFLSLASSTIGNGNQNGGLSISGGATTTGHAYFASNVGIQNVAPAYALDVAGFINTNQYSGYKQAGNTVLYASTTNNTLAIGASTAAAWMSASSTPPWYSIAIGQGASATASDGRGTYNIAIGYNALTSNSNGVNNVALGVQALANNNDDWNTAIGYDTLYSNSNNGFESTAVGGLALYSNLASRNNAFGYFALYNNTTGLNNVAMGSFAGQTLLAGSNNTFLGNSANVAAAASTTLTNSTAIGDGAIVTASNQMVFGNTSITKNLFSGSVGIGTTSPEATLTVVGSICAARGAGTQTTACTNTTGEIDASASSLSGGYDVAEAYPTSDASLEAGDIVTFDPSTPGSVVRAAAADVAFLGVISTNPALTLGAVSSSTRPIALAGRVPVRVNLDGGTIAIGDPIALSTVPGVGARATTTEETIGVALAPYDGTGSSTIEVFVKPGLASRKSAGGVAGLLGSILSQITVWLGNAGNGIGDLFATTIHAENVVATTGTFQTLCVADTSGASTCITKPELDAILQKQAVSARPSAAPMTAPPAPSSSTISISPDTATSTATTTTDASSIIPDYNATTTLPLAPAVAASISNTAAPSKTSSDAASSSPTLVE